MSGPHNAKIFFVSDIPGYDDARAGHALAGGPGAEFNRMLSEAGLSRHEVYVVNLFRDRPNSGDPAAYYRHPKDGRKPALSAKLRSSLLAGGEWQDAGNGAIVHVRHAADIDQLKRTIDLIQPSVVVPLGNAPLHVLTGDWGLSKWRGSMLGGNPGPKIIPTFHPVQIQRQWELRHIALQDLRRIAANRLTRQYAIPEWRFILRPDIAQVRKTLGMLYTRALEGPLKLVLDIETRARHMACIGLGWSALDAICIPFQCVERDSGYWTEEEEAWIILALIRLLSHPNVLTVGQNLIYDYQYLFREWGFHPDATRDTMINHHLAWPGLQKSLDFQSSLYCEYYRFWKDDGKEWDRKTGEDQLWEYNCRDCSYTWECDEETAAAVGRLGMGHLSARRHEHMRCALEAMFRGVRVDKATRSRFSEELGKALREREAYLEAVTGHPLNPRSPAQLSRFFYDDLKLPPIFNRKNRNPDRKPSTDAEALGKFLLKDPALAPIINRLEECRSIGVFKSTFVDATLDVDSRLRCSYNICGTETFRLSSSENAFGSGTNLQNVPTGDEELDLPNVRKIFVPDSGMICFDMDLDRADLQVVVWEADDEELREALRSGEDIHTLNAKTLGISRPLAKRWVHGTNYGGQARTMAVGCGITVHQAERMRKRWFEAHPGILAWHTRTQEQLHRSRTVRNAFGYRRVYFDRPDGLLPEALAWVPQSTVAIVINEVWSLIRARFPEVQVLLQVHDSLFGQYPAHKHEYYSQALPALAREVVIPYAKPLVIPAGINTSPISWGHCK